MVIKSLLARYQQCQVWCSECKDRIDSRQYTLAMTAALCGVVKALLAVVLRQVSSRGLLTLRLLLEVVRQLRGEGPVDRQVRRYE